MASSSCRCVVVHGAEQSRAAERLQLPAQSVTCMLAAHCMRRSSVPRPAYPAAGKFFPCVTAAAAGRRNTDRSSAHVKFPPASPLCRHSEFIRSFLSFPLSESIGGSSVPACLHYLSPGLQLHPTLLTKHQRKIAGTYLASVYVPGNTCDRSC